MDSATTTSGTASRGRRIGWSGAQSSVIAGLGTVACVDRELPADRPELLIYELRGGRLRLLDAENLLFVDWNPTVSCVEHGGELAAHHGGQGTTRTGRQ
jgi:hypothetical protein